MKFFTRNLLILLFALPFLGCESKNRYDIRSDQALTDMDKRISSLSEDLNTLETELEEVQAVLKDSNIDTDLRSSLRKEIHEGKKHAKDIEQWIAYLKVRRKKREQSLFARKDDETLEQQAKSEIEAYFMEKKFKPIKRPWKDRYRTAIEL